MKTYREMFKEAWTPSNKYVVANVGSYVKSTNVEKMLANAAEFFSGAGTALFVEDEKNKIVCIFSAGNPSSVKEFYSREVAKFGEHSYKNPHLVSDQAGRNLGRVLRPLGALTYDEEGKVTEKVGDIPSKVNRKFTFK